MKKLIPIGNWINADQNTIETIDLAAKLVYDGLHLKDKADFVRIEMTPGWIVLAGTEDVKSKWDEFMAMASAVGK